MDETKGAWLKKPRQLLLNAGLRLRITDVFNNIGVSLTLPANGWGGARACRSKTIIAQRSAPSIKAKIRADLTDYTSQMAKR